MHIPRNAFKQALLEGRQQYGFWLGLASNVSAELCAHIGYDWLLIDGEHAPNTIPAILSQLQAIAGTDSHPAVRAVNDDPALIKQLLDIGAQTLLVPMVETAEQARRIVQAMNYPPKGMRGVGTVSARATRWTLVADYFAEAPEQLCLLIQIETVRGLENLDSILQVEGIDGVFIGPSDLAASMGHLGQPAHPEVKAALKAAATEIRAAGKFAGTLATSKALAKEYEADGMQFIALGLDALSLADSAKNILKRHLASEEPG